MTHTLDVITYANVVMGGTVCIALTMAVLHDLQVNIADTLNAYVMVPNKKDMDSTRF